MGLGLLVLLLLCFFMCVIFLMRFYYKDREDELLLGTSMANDFPAIRIQKEKSPYVITPTQKITQRFLSGQKTPSMIECNFEDIAGILDFMASNIETVDDAAFRPAHLKARLVPRARTKFDDSQAPPFEIEPSLQKMMFAQSPRFRGEAMKSELNRREQEGINKNLAHTGKPNREAGNKEVPNPRKGGRKSQFEHDRQRRKRLRPSNKLREGKSGHAQMAEKKKLNRKLSGTSRNNGARGKGMNRVENKNE
uniref:Uncharacterized protein n=1 Tax=Ascaris lumbricoides TaxID=6252 RepID=A0A0M3IK39_ASCLU